MWHISSQWPETWHNVFIQSKTQSAQCVKNGSDLLRLIEQNCSLSLRVCGSQSEVIFNYTHNTPPSNNIWCNSRQGSELLLKSDSSTFLSVRHVNVWNRKSTVDGAALLAAWSGSAARSYKLELEQRRRFFKLQRPPLVTDNLQLYGVLASHWVEDIELESVIALWASILNVVYLCYRRLR